MFLVSSALLDMFYINYWMPEHKSVGFGLSWLSLVALNAFCFSARAQNDSFKWRLVSNKCLGLSASHNCWAKTFDCAQTVRDLKKKKNHNFPRHNTVRINRADFWWQTNHQRVILKDIDCDTLLAEAPALCFSSLIVVASERDKKRQSDTARAESSWISAPDDRSSLCLRNTAEIRLGKRVNAAVRKRCRQ